MDGSEFRAQLVKRAERMKQNSEYSCDEDPDPDDPFEMWAREIADE